MTDRKELSKRFLVTAGWGTSDRWALAGDASDRRYDRLSMEGHSAVLMDAPPGTAEDTATFARIARHLADLGLSPPAIYAEDHENGFLLLEDLGDGLFSRLIAHDPGLEGALYAGATDVLLAIHNSPTPIDLPDLSAREWAEAAAFVLSWYVFAVSGEEPKSAKFVTVLEELMRAYADDPRVMILRDYHAENLLWLPDRHDVARVGLLDFQLAQMGQPGYDLVSLLQDARRDVSAKTEAAMIARFCTGKGIDPDVFAPSYATLGAQRALRILGVFARLCLKNGKGGYVSLMPRVWTQLQRNLAHPSLTPLAEICSALLPEPDPEALERIGNQCGRYAHR